jgi:hypothetical protein
MHGASFVPDQEDNERIAEPRRRAQIQRWLGKEQSENFFSMRSFAVPQVKELTKTQLSVTNMKNVA